MLLITSGFAETGAEGRRLEEKLVEAAREADILILGPTTMGICNPHDTLFCCGSNVQPKPTRNGIFGILRWNWRMLLPISAD